MTGKGILLFFALFYILLSFWSRGYSSEPPASVRTSPAAEGQGINGAVLQNLFTKARKDGRVRVIARLRAAFVPEGKISASHEVSGQRSGISRLQASLKGSLSGYGVGEIKTFKYIPYVALEADETTLRALASNPLVAGIEEDALSPPLLGQSISIVGADVAWSSGYSGQGWTVAVLDTGVDSSHGFLRGKIVSEACYSTTRALLSAASLCPNGESSQTGSGAGINCPGTIEGCDHGTHVAGIVAGKGSFINGVAKDADLISIQIFSKINSATECGGDTKLPCILTFTSDQILALERVYELRSAYNIAAVNMSVGSGDFASHCDFAVPALRDAVANLRSVGIPTVAASGNDGYIDRMTSPACLSNAVSVGATAKSDVVADYSNSASFLNLLAPGDHIFSSVPGDFFEVKSGTSMAAPHVSGAWAILRRYKPSASVDEILSALTSTGVPVTDARNGITKPRIRIDAAMKSLGADCSSAVSPALTVFVPVFTLDGSSFWLDLQYLPGRSDLLFRVTNFGRLTDSAPFAGCSPATFSTSTLTMRIPDLRLGGVSYWVDLLYVGQGSDLLLKVTDYGLN